MTRYSFSHLADAELLRELAATTTQDRLTTARLVALLAETDARGLYAPAGYPSLFAYCVGHLGMSEDVASKRIQVARAARKDAAIPGMLADGRLNLSGLALLAPHAEDERFARLLEAAQRKTNAQIHLLLAEFFPRPDLPTFVRALDAPAAPAMVEPVPAVGLDSPPTPRVDADAACSGSSRVACENREQHAVRHVDGTPAPTPRPTPAPAPPARVTPLAPQRYALQVTLGQEAHDHLQQARDLLGRGTPASEVSEVLASALELYVRHLQLERCGHAAKPRPARRPADPRRVPAEVRGKVWARDHGQCTFVGDSGHRCEARTHLELDHVKPVARGGTSEPSNLRLRCRTHNQLEADRVFGRAFMAAKRRPT